MQIYQMKMSQLDEKLGIYVCASDGERKRLAPSGDKQTQRSIDGVNSEWQGAETLSFYIQAFSQCPSLSLSVNFFS